MLSSHHLQGRWRVAHPFARFWRRVGNGHADRVVIALTHANYRLTRPKYGTTLVDARAGEITWRPAELAAIESTSSHVIEQILIEPRPFSLGPFAPKEPVKVPPKRR